MATTEDDFHRMLDENPDDHHTRMVFADWLEERGDPRAEGYRALGKLGRVPWLPEHGGKDWIYGWNYDKYWKENLHREGTFGYTAQGKDTLPKSWNEKAREILPSVHGGLYHTDRRTLEDAAALAFGQLPPDSKEHIMGQANPHQLARVSASVRKYLRSKRGRR